MKKIAIVAQLEILAWALRLTYSGMTVAMIRYRLLQKHEALEQELQADERTDSLLSS